MVSKDDVEQLEKSGLSEEHGAPCFVQTVLHSPESSQDSSKRRKVVLPSPSQAKNGGFLFNVSLFSIILILHQLQHILTSDFVGNILRIKIKRDQDSPRSVLEKPTVLEQPSIKQAGLSSSQLNKPNSIQQHSKVTSKSAAGAHQRISVEHQAVLEQASTQLPSLFARRDDPQLPKGVRQMDSKLSLKPPVGRVGHQPFRVDPPSAKVAQRDLLGKAAPANVRVDPQVLSAAEIQRKCPPQPKVSQEVFTPAIRQQEKLQPPLVQNSRLEAPHLQRPNASVSKEEPSSSGRNAEATQGQETKQSKSDRKKSRKAEKKEKKFRDLFVTWNPPSFEMEDSDVGVQDWLFGSTRNSDASMTNCRASDGSVPFQSMEQQPSLQPRATFLPDLQMYQLPYVVPF